MINFDLLKGIPLELVNLLHAGNTGTTNNKLLREVFIFLGE